MANPSDDVDARLAKVERQLRRYQLGTSAAFSIVLVTVLGGWVASQQRNILHASGLIIEDSTGQARVIVGAPVPDPAGGPRRSPATGLVINDGTGYERFGVTLSADGNMGMGFDAPPGMGAGRNPERITLNANREGGAELRMLGQDSRVRAHMVLFRDNTAALFFTEYEPDRTIVHRLNATGDSIFVHER